MNQLPKKDLRVIVVLFFFCFFNWTSAKPQGPANNCTQHDPTSNNRLGVAVTDIINSLKQTNARVRKLEQQMSVLLGDAGDTRDELGNVRQTNHETNHSTGIPGWLRTRTNQGGDAGELLRQRIVEKFFAELDVLFGEAGPGDAMRISPQWVADQLTGESRESRRTPKDIFNPKGYRGPPGPPGLPGATGAKGSKGDNGVEGVKGAVGDKGSLGDKGVEGVKGAIGDKGLLGDKGPQGDKGADGIKGAIGDKGPVGDKGEGGVKGSDGDKGAPGDKGLPGEPGAQPPGGR